ncbi:response regulator transcription factor [Bradyrhizobium jicamae]|uniref:response regulator transcription factor n=1 Tax=Bradyrhizobium jicamae TaxID=280332 RepID=UPI0020119212|nr:LuxR C-terminal-related transcriptional regulator [Bradyrhizobium jicamae]
MPLAKWPEERSALEMRAEAIAVSTLRVQAAEEAGAAIARQFNGPMTALLLYMNEIKQHSHQFSQSPGNRIYLQQIVENALEQTERVCAMLKQISDLHPAVPAAIELKPARETQPARAPDMVLSPEAGQKPLTKREREVLNLISEGYSNKQGALRMNISPRTFESHRAEAMRKLGARNTADLVRKALLHP